MTARHDPFEILDVCPILRIDGIDAALAFYRDYLGFHLDWLNRVDDQSPAYMQVSRQGCTLHLSEFPEDTAMAGTVFIRSRGIRALAHELQGRESTFGKPVITRSHYRSAKFTLTDPFGNRLRFDESDMDWQGPA